jgi:hypothetical protein
MGAKWEVEFYNNQSGTDEWAWRQVYYGQSLWRALNTWRLLRKNYAIRLTRR